MKISKELAFHFKNITICFQQFRLWYGVFNGLTQDLFMLLRGRLDFGFWR